MGTPSLLGLPQELRDIILDLVLFTERAPPQDEATALEGRVNRHDCTDSEYERWTNRVLHEDLEDATASGPLLRVNRKLAADTRRALARPRKNKADLLRQPYILDILAVSGRRLLPTWLFAPALVLNCTTVLAEIRPRIKDMTLRDRYLEDFADRKREALLRRYEAGLDPDVPSDENAPRQDMTEWENDSRKGEVEAQKTDEVEDVSESCDRTRGRYPRKRDCRLPSFASADNVILVE
ncbi:hypothetical protein T310_2231 [Rasamsonia emersonii CBS 393.64]|uniref:F-box domain-containing protein n=1 Tax=Rasamsonia emersonii (strain ATCC 16479 / CBS 393.64 / IMI 116815) TaxID=1408163 RepID=A0A0F4YZV5_RASE3|nr:hypothetical protein T310_2231 [Rasamsonia emersonii CBS 393.64]KKA23779.1 hypothetical protein T310_2231 [Rasamsonia emersonii CBS 393.64]